MKKFFILSALIFAITITMISATTSHAADWEHMKHKNAIQLKLGYGQLITDEEDNEMFDVYGLDNDDYTQRQLGISYERKLTMMIGFELGYIKNTIGHYNRTNYGVLTFSDSLNMEMNQDLWTASLKLYIPLGTTFVLYAGGGVSYYYNVIEAKYSDGGITTQKRVSDEILGAHAMAGLEYYLFKGPLNESYPDVPVTLYIEGFYNVATLDEADDKLIDAINNDQGTTYDYHELVLDSGYVIGGVKWYF